MKRRRPGKHRTADGGARGHARLAPTLHKIYKATDKLKEVERQLRQAGYDLE